MLCYSHLQLIGSDQCPSPRTRLRLDFISQQQNNAYTSKVRNSKFIHVFLIAILCFGQVTANVHQVKHLHIDDCASAFSLDSAYCKSPPSLARLSKTRLDTNHVSHAGHSGELQRFSHALHHAQHKHEANPVVHPVQAEPDCELYHVLLGMSGVLHAPPLSVDSTLANQARGAYKFVQVVKLAHANQPIRAPPTYS